MSLERDVEHILDGPLGPPLADSWGGPDPDSQDDEQWRQMVLTRLNRLHAAVLRIARDIEQ